MKKVLKKITASLMSGLMLCSSTYVVAGAANNEVQPRGTWAMYGDVNNDGSISMIDLVYVNRAVSKFEELTGSSELPLEYAVARPTVYFGENDSIPQAADIDGDNYITANDSRLLMNRLVECDDEIGRCGQFFYIN